LDRPALSGSATKNVSGPEVIIFLPSSLRQGFFGPRRPFLLRGFPAIDEINKNVSVFGDQ
jgi:hypothetical protein